MIARNGAKVFIKIIFELIIKKIGYQNFTSEKIKRISKQVSLFQGTKYDKHVTNLWEEVNDPDFTPTEGTTKIGTRSRPRPPPGPKDTRLIKLPRISPT